MGRRRNSTNSLTIQEQTYPSSQRCYCDVQHPSALGLEGPSQAGCCPRCGGVPGSNRRSLRSAREHSPDSVADRNGRQKTSTKTEGQTSGAVLSETPTNNEQDHPIFQEIYPLYSQDRPADSSESSLTKKTSKPSKSNSKKRRLDSEEPSTRPKNVEKIRKLTSPGPDDTESMDSSPSLPEDPLNPEEPSMDTGVGEKESSKIRLTLRKKSTSDASSVELPQPSPQPSLTTEESDQNSLENTVSPTALKLSTPSSSVDLESGERVHKRAIDGKLASDAIVHDEESPQRPEKIAMLSIRSDTTPSGDAARIEVPESLSNNAPRTRRAFAQQKKIEKEKKEMEMYVPNIDPLADPKDDFPLPSPFELAKSMYTETSCAHFERTLGETFPEVGPAPSKKSSLRVDWPEDAEGDHTKEMKAWAKKEQKWAKTGVPVKHRAPWSFNRAPKNAKELKRYLNSHGRTRKAASRLHLPDDRPLQRPDYVSEYTTLTKGVLQLQERFEVHRGALHIGAEDFESFGQSLKEFAAVKNFRDEDEFDYEDNLDHEFHFVHEEDSKTQSKSHAESYVERMLRIKLHPPNGTIEYEDRIDQHHDGTIREVTSAMKRGDVSGASVPSERWYFNKESQRNFPEHSNTVEKKKADAKLAALELMEMKRDLNLTNSPTSSPIGDARV